jgi:hypothetical protein
VLSIEPDRIKIQDAVFYKVAIAIDPTDKPIKPGMTANVIVTTAEIADTLSIPVRAVRTVDGVRRVRMLEKVAEVLGDSLVGIDFIIDDVRKPWRQQPRSGVIECNGAPFIDLHLFPLVGKPRNTPGALWDLLLKE